MKYIVGKKSEYDREMPVAFSEMMNHAKVADALNFPIIVSAGFIYYEPCLADDPKIYCMGSSTSLRVSSRGDEDTKLFLNMLRN